MAYRLFHDVFPVVAEQETRTLTILPGAQSSLPVGDYGFLEMFCDEPGCEEGDGRSLSISAGTTTPE